jgi:hypothetical protein
MLNVDHVTDYYKKTRRKTKTKKGKTMKALHAHIQEELNP